MTASRPESASSERVRSWWRLAVTAASVIVLIFHFGMTLLYLTPLNPIKARHLDQVNGYMSPYFAQTWELFGPNPNGRNKSVWIQCRLAEREAKRDSDWYDITSPLMRVHHAYRLSPAQRLLRAETPTYQLFMPEDPVLKTLRKLPQQDAITQTAVRDIEAEREHEFKLGLRVAGRVASGYCDRLFGAGLATEVRTRIVFREAPEFRNRNNPDSWPEPTGYDTDWQPYERVAARL